MAENDPDLDIQPRDLVILKARVANPTVSIRELSEILDEEYGISLSHNRVNEILRTMDERDVFRETIIPDENLFNHYLFRLEFHYPNFEEHWRECYWTLVEDPHVLMFFNADSNYHWQMIMQFRTSEQMQRWLHEFFKEYGDLIGGFHNTVLAKVHKFRTNPEIFDDILRETAEGRRYLDGDEE